ncbi:hypothetical protein AG1IA_07391 [Rhizoctonia solani AG-1 IA]|uniref:Uncharacterized protein n=1 Tax=Thanatephorus cucumeris (strain AG1-IA) TaxID=983506 RepID=L8WP71_THACA|nr:hypothetical protein AG1IA_07391 [Rhizoctonia solani AG-1 IA]
MRPVQERLATCRPRTPHTTGRKASSRVPESVQRSSFRVESLKWRKPFE